MPRRDGSGPNAQGPMTGRGLGNCTNSPMSGGVGIGNSLGLGRRGLGRSMRCGNGKFMAYDQTYNQVQYNDKAILQEQKALLQNRLEEINKLLEDKE